MAIVAFCNPLLDISVKIESKDLLEKFALLENNVILAEEKHSTLIEDMLKLKSDSLEYCAGGAGLNSLRAAQLMLPEGETSIVGSIGRDRFGDILMQKSIEDGIKPFLTRHSPKETGHCACLISNHNRSLVAFLEAANDFVPEKLDLAVDAIQSASLFYITGFFLAISRGSVERLLSMKPASTKVMFNLSAPFVCAMFGPELPDIFGNCVDFIVGNSDELFAWAEAVKLPSQLTFEEAVMELSKAFPKATLIITHGSAPILIKTPGKEALSSVPVPPIPSTEIVDTTGAGDAFVGGLLASLERDLGLEMGVKVGCFLAGQVIRQPGIRFPSALQLQEFIDSLLHKL